MGGGVVYTKARVREWRKEQERLAAAAQAAKDALRRPSTSSHPSPRGGGASTSSVSRETPTNLASKRLTPFVCGNACPRKRVRYTQSILDVGQRGIDWTKCAKCGMEYVGGSGEDIRRHKVTCKKFTRQGVRGCAALNFESWNDVYTDPENGLYARLTDGSRIIAAGPSLRDNLKRATAVDAHVSELLGCPGEEISSLPGRWLALFVVGTRERNISAYALVQVVGGGRCVRIDENGCAVVADSQRVSSVMLGVRRIWTAPKARLMSQASELLDAARRFILPGDVLAQEAIAFTTPTETGALFATKYCRSQDVVVYDDSDVSR